MSFTQLVDKSKHQITNPNGSLATFTPNIDVIAYSLCFLNRFNGHVGAYSVAQHSVHVYQQLKFLYPTDHRLHLSGLLHDATEAYLGDVSSPLKALLPDYKEIESHYHDVIDEFYGIDTRCKVVKDMDLRILATEGKSFGLDLVVDQLDDMGVSPYEFTIKRDKPDDVYRVFISIFHYLMASIDEEKTH